MKRGPDIRAVIMAGGSGTRFWPLSRRSTPKQFLPITSQRTMIEETFRRILPLIPPRKIFTVANAAQSRTIRRLVPRLPEGNLLVEPAAKNTAPSLILATAHIFLRNPEAVVVVLASDHLIARPEAFLRKLAAAAEAAAHTDGLITFGVRPTFASTGYGYIHYAKSGARLFSGESFYPALAFREKPTVETAADFIKSGDYAWNSGMFLWRASAFARKLERHAPAFFVYWERTLEALKRRSRAALTKIFAEIPAMSIDYALMEKAEGTLVCEGDFGWSDVGAWSALADIWPRDGQGNSFKGEAVAVEATGNICYNPGKITALVGVRDLVVIETKDALLICRKDLDQDVKTVLERLARTGGTKYL
jgi:mannose-1-phosphate guanylyltransferase